MYICTHGVQKHHKSQAREKERKRGVEINICKKNIQKNKQEVLYHHFTDTFVKCYLNENLIMVFIYCPKEIIVSKKKINVKRQDHHHREGLIKSKYLKKKIINSY